VSFSWARKEDNLLRSAFVIPKSPNIIIAATEVIDTHMPYDSGEKYLAKVVTNRNREIAPNIDDKIISEDFLIKSPAQVLDKRYFRKIQNFKNKLNKFFIVRSYAL